MDSKPSGNPNAKPICFTLIISLHDHRWAAAARWRSARRKTGSPTRSTPPRLPSRRASCRVRFTMYRSGGIWVHVEIVSGAYELQPKPALYGVMLVVKTAVELLRKAVGVHPADTHDVPEAFTGKRTHCCT